MCCNAHTVLIFEASTLCFELLQHSHMARIDPHIRCGGGKLD